MTPCSPAEKPALILGLGNAILCDDGVGIKVARHIAENHPTADVVVKEAEVAGFALLDLLEGFDRAVVVDAVRLPDAEPGEIVVLDLGVLTPSLHLVSGHQIDLPTALEMGRQLGRSMPASVHIVGVQVEDDRTFDERCTPAVEAAVPAAAEVALKIAHHGR
jgi:hydrogenase maturation protease